MNKGNLKVLAAATIAMVVLLVALQYGGRDTERVDGRLFPALRDRINDITTIGIVRAGEDAEIVIRKTSDGWVSTTRNDYPADVGKIREALLLLADARLVEQKTANPELYGQLGVLDPAAEGSKGTRLTMSGDGIDFDLVLGNLAQPGYRYARKFAEAQSWLIDKNPTLPKSAADWLIKDIIDIKSDAVRSVTISHPDGEEIRVSKETAEQTDFEVADVPDGRELSYATVGNGIAGVLNALTFDDVRAGDAFADGAVTTRFDLFEGGVVEIRSMEEDGAQWITVSADPDVATATRLAGWRFRIASFKANQLTRRWDDILKAEPEPDVSE